MPNSNAYLCKELLDRYVLPFGVLLSLLHLPLPVRGSENLLLQGRLNFESWEYHGLMTQHEMVKPLAGKLLATAFICVQLRNHSVLVMYNISINNTIVLTNIHANLRFRMNI